MTNRLSLALFAWGIVACAISRWRVAGIGIGEVIVGLASVLVLFRISAWPNLSPVRQLWARFVGISVIALFTGTLWAKAIDVWQPVGFAHDMLALLFCFGSLTMLLLVLTETNQRAFFLRHFLRASLVLVMANLLFYSVSQLYLGEATFWIGRFNGLSANPNQLALYVCLLPFWLVRSPLVLTRLETIVGLGSCVSVGWLTGSDALLLAWLIGFVWLIAYSIRAFPWRRNPIQNAHAKVYLIVMLTLCLGAAVVLLWPYVADVYAIGGQGDLRLLRWQNGLIAVGHSPLFGLGPGAFSGDTAAFDEQEAHNLYIDWMASGGAVAGLALIWFQRQTWLKIRASQSGIVQAAFVSLLIFSSFHYVARHPVFWLYHLLFLLNQSPSCAGFSVR